jgi:RNA polymerase sigma factor (sigma-70 family)
VSSLSPNDYKIINLEPKSRDEMVKYVFDHFGEEIKRLIFTYVKNFSQTDDVFQEFLITVYQKFDSFKGESQLKTWLYRIAINKCKDYLRSPIHRLQFATNKIMDATYNKSPEQHVVLEESEKEIIEAVLSLPIKYREIFILRFYKSLSIKEISELIGVNESTVKTRLSRGKSKLEKLLGGDYIEI